MATNQNKYAVFISPKELSFGTRQPDFRLDLPFETGKLTYAYLFASSTDVKEVDSIKPELIAPPSALDVLIIYSIKNDIDVIRAILVSQKEFQFKAYYRHFAFNIYGTQKGISYLFAIFKAIKQQQQNPPFEFAEDPSKVHFLWVKQSDSNKSDNPLWKPSTKENFLRYPKFSQQTQGSAQKEAQTLLLTCQLNDGALNQNDPNQTKIPFIRFYDPNATQNDTKQTKKTRVYAIPVKFVESMQDVEIALRNLKINEENNQRAYVIQAYSQNYIIVHPDYEDRMRDFTGPGSFEPILKTESFPQNDFEKAKDKQKEKFVTGIEIEPNGSLTVYYYDTLQ